VQRQEQGVSQRRVADDRHPVERRTHRLELRRQSYSADYYGSTYGFRTHFRSLVAIQATPETSSQRMAASCAAINIIVIIMKLWNCRFSVIKSKEISELTVHRSVP
jgi:hypothetical protein